MNSNNNVDQAAALILCSEEKQDPWVSEENGSTLGQGRMRMIITTSRIETTGIAHRPSGWLK